ncbi:hypothetical protein SMD44_p20009 (plasmid) [Streptomyces alboflavus]|uniref:Uncharacterized protein n=1 Tax=Streptomyces alboflavus TaxID=67267 RepID=A0A291W5H3_9ACTN|nr:hypothetical protein SMD44_p20009 [Streptomyces alboflavus]
MVRTTSALAESTLKVLLNACSRSDHLRSRGEHDTDSQDVTTKSGPPPLSRRAHSSHAPQTPSHRTTSALAESTPTAMASPVRTTDHLRSRGEHAMCGDVGTDYVGPPPLSRRAHRGGMALLGVRRTTSALAESTAMWCKLAVAVADHLRSRGEHQSLPTTITGWRGPPPLSRRALDVPPHPGRKTRTTSALAESTTWS